MRTNLIKARIEKELSQTDIALRLGISTRHYCRLEAGTSDGSIKVWQQLRLLLHAKSIDYLLEQVDLDRY